MSSAWALAERAEDGVAGLLVVGAVACVGGLLVVAAGSCPGGVTGSDFSASSWGSDDESDAYRGRTPKGGLANGDTVRSKTTSVPERSKTASSWLPGLRSGACRTKFASQRRCELRRRRRRAPRHRCRASGRRLARRYLRRRGLNPWLRGTAIPAAAEEKLLDGVSRHRVVPEVSRCRTGSNEGEHANEWAWRWHAPTVSLTGRTSRRLRAVPRRLLGSSPVLLRGTGRRRPVEAARRAILTGTGRPRCSL